MNCNWFRAKRLLRYLYNNDRYSIMMIGTYTIMIGTYVIMIIAGNGSISMLEINQGVQTEMSRNRQTRGSTREEHSNNNASKHCLPRSEQLRTITEKRSELSRFSAVSRPFLYLAVFRRGWLPGGCDRVPIWRGRLRGVFRNNQNQMTNRVLHLVLGSVDCYQDRLGSVPLSFQ